MRAGTLLAIVVLWSLLAVSCSQDNIFYTISTETAPRKPRIEGAPTNMVVFQREYSDPNDGNKKIIPIMYVASGRLHWYAQLPDAGKPEWDLGQYAIPQPTGGKIIALAVTSDAAGGDRLYALCHDKSNAIDATLRYIESKTGSEWKTIGSGIIQSIYADPQQKRLFAGTGKSTYDIAYVDNDDTLRTLRSNAALLSGAVYREEEGVGTYYLSTIGDGTRGGIFQVTESALDNNSINETTVIPLLFENTAQDSHRMFMSMIKLKDNTIIAVERERDGGGVYEVSNGSFARMWEPLELTATYTGSEKDISYQWYKDDNLIEDATDRTYTPDTTGSYTVTVTVTVTENETENETVYHKTSTPVTIPADTRDLIGIITINPHTGVEIGTALTATYTGNETVSYQWYKDDNPIAGATDLTYTPDEAGRYTVTVSAAGRNRKTSAEVTVQDDTGDDLSGIITITRTGNQIIIGKYATEALALWEDRYDPSTQLLIVGIQGGLYSTTTNSHTYGYVEFKLNPHRGLKIIDSRHDSDSNSLLSIHDQERYKSSLRKHPINHLFQAPKEIDPDMTFFASTQTTGLWSYRDRSEGWQWNAEE